MSLCLLSLSSRENPGAFERCETGRVPAVVGLFPGPVSSMGNGLGGVVLWSLVFLIKGKVIFQNSEWKRLWYFGFETVGTRVCLLKGSVASLYKAAGPSSRYLPRAALQQVC